MTTQVPSSMIADANITTAKIADANVTTAKIADANVNTLSICGYNEQSSTVAGGTTKYRIGFNSATSLLSVLDRSVVPSQVLNNGWVVNAVYEGRRLSVNGLPSATGTWVRGDYVKNGAPAVGSPKGWYCTVAGTPGTWVSEGNL